MEREISLKVNFGKQKNRREVGLLEKI